MRFSANQTTKKNQKPAQLSLSFPFRPGWLGASLGLLLSIGLLSGSPSNALAKSFRQAVIDETEELDEIYEVVPGKLFRGPQLKQRDFKTLKKHHIKTIIDLRDENPFGTELEEERARANGFKFIHEPMSAIFKPSDEQVDRILALINDPEAQPVYLHCLLGHDRTGLLIGLYRVLNQNFPIDEAYQEMLNYGFKPFLLELKYYFFKRAETYRPGAPEAAKGLGATPVSSVSSGSPGSFKTAPGKT